MSNSTLGIWNRSRAGWWLLAAAAAVSAALLVVAIGKVSFGGGGGDWTFLVLTAGALAFLVAAMAALRGAQSGSVSSWASMSAADRPLDGLVSLVRVSRAMAADMPLSELVPVIVEACVDSFDCDESSLMLYDPVREELAVAAFSGHQQPQLVRRARVRLGESIAGTVARTRQALILGETLDENLYPNFQQKSRIIASSMVAPLVHRNRLIGVLNVSTGDPRRAFHVDDLRLLCLFAEHAGIAAGKAKDAERVGRLLKRFRAMRRDARAAAEARPVDSAVTSDLSRSKAA